MTHTLRTVRATALVAALAAIVALPGLAAAQMPSPAFRHLPSIRSRSVWGMARPSRHVSSG